MYIQYFFFIRLHIKGIHRKKQIMHDIGHHCICFLYTTTSKIHIAQVGEICMECCWKKENNFIIYVAHEKLIQMC